MACAKRAACETTRSKALRVVYEHLDLGRRLGEYKERLKRLRRLDVALNERNREAFGHVFVNEGGDVNFPVWKIEPELNRRNCKALIPVLCDIGYSVLECYVSPEYRFFCVVINLDSIFWEPRPTNGWRNPDDRVKKHLGYTYRLHPPSGSFASAASRFPEPRTEFEYLCCLRNISRCAESTWMARRMAFYQALRSLNRRTYLFHVLLWINPDYADDDDVEYESFDIDEESIEEEEISYADKVAVVPALCWLGYRVQQWHPEIAAGDVDTVGVVLTVFTGSLALENDDDYAYDFVVDSEGWCRRGTLRWKMHPALGPAT